MLAVMNDSGGAQGPERAFITPLSGGQGRVGGEWTCGAEKEASGAAGARERLTLPSPLDSRVFSSALALTTVNLASRLLAASLTKELGKGGGDKLCP